MAFWTYMLHCAGGAFYVGHTDDLEQRVAEHEQGAVAGFTRDHLPVRLVWSEPFASREDALTMERRLKGWGRAKKMALIRNDWDRISLLARGRPKDRASTGSARTDGMRRAR
jgi:putative endonuclease